MSQKLRKFIFLIFLFLLPISFFLRDDYKSVDNIRPELLQAPIQSEVDSQDRIQFTKDGYSYNLTPVAKYQIQAFVVHQIDYRFFSIYNADSVFPVDLCLIWGDNLKNKSYQDKYLSFHQDSRFCFYRWKHDNTINPNLLSNNHLIASDSEILSTIDKIKAGDQVSISGFLVDVEATKVGEVSDYDPDSFKLQSSLTRTDTGAGACEIIYVKDIKILQTAHPVWSSIFKLSILALIGLTSYSIILILTHRRRHRL